MLTNTLTMNVADYVAEFLKTIKVVRVHGLMGGGASGLNDGFIRNPEIDYKCYHHEQAAAYAALGEIRVSKTWGVFNPTTGCGGTNGYTPILNAWQDSLPLVVISGNVSLPTLAQTINQENDLNLRAFGVQENNIIQNVQSITKYAALLEKADDIEVTLVDAFVAAATDRKGPVWIDIPADLQHTYVSDNIFKSIPLAVARIEEQIEGNSDLSPPVSGSVNSQIEKLIHRASRPLILVGGGASNDTLTKTQVVEFISKHQIPVASTYAGTDIIDHNYETYLGCIGIKGNRAANFAAQNCDLLLVLGSRMPFGAIGYDTENFAKHADIVVVDIDADELKKNDVFLGQRHVPINTSIGKFLKSDFEFKNVDPIWRDKCAKTKIIWNNIAENIKYFNYEEISIYHVMNELNSEKYDYCNFVIDAGSISYVGPTSLKYTNNRNFIFSPAQADMGCALPSALGVAAISPQRTICITGDGSFMSNLQELATFGYNQYNLSVIILNNSGYMSISNTQKNNYGPNRMYGEHDGRGLTFPDYSVLSRAFGLSYTCIDRIEDLSNIEDGRINVIEIKCLKEETIAPYQTRIDGKQAGAHDMAPFRDLNELKYYSSVQLDYAR